VATFWNTPIYVPPQRNEFSDSLQHSKKINITVAGTFDVKPGDVIELRVNNMSAYPSPISGTESILNDKYYVLTIKHTITSTGVHETYITASKILPNDLSTGL
jgi:hypothetical protein